jgi:hypothetical protein
MFGRLLVYLGQMWLELRPHVGLNDRFDVAAVVVNLSGAGHTSRDMRWPEAGLRTELLAREVNLGSLEAGRTLDEIEAGRVTRTALAFVPLMQNGGDPAMIQRWLAVASLEPDVRRRGDFGYLTKLFAEKADCWDVWDQALKGWNMVVSKQVELWKAEGEAKGTANALLQVLGTKFDPLPPELVASVRDAPDLAVLKGWLVDAVRASTLDDFRQATKL